MNCTPDTELVVHKLYTGCITSCTWTVYRIPRTCFSSKYQILPPALHWSTFSNHLNISRRHGSAQIFLRQLTWPKGRCMTSQNLKSVQWKTNFWKYTNLNRIVRVVNLNRIVRVVNLNRIVRVVNLNRIIRVVNLNRIIRVVRSLRKTTVKS